MKNQIYSVLIFILLMNPHITSSQWIQKSIGLQPNAVIQSFATIDTNLFASDRYGLVYRSTDYGDNWTSASNGLTSEIYKLASIGNYLFAASANGGVYRSTNFGANWQQVNTGITDTHILSLIVKGTYLYAGTYNYGHGIFFTTNFGLSWIKCFNTARVYGLFLMDDNIFAGTLYNGAYRSTNSGWNWTEINNGLNSPVFCFTSIGNRIFAGTRNGGVYTSLNNGDNWVQVNNGLTHDADIVVASKDTILFAGSTGTGGVFFSSNYGINWTAMNQGFIIVPPVHFLYIVNNYLFAGTYDQLVWRRDLSDIFGIKKMTENVPEFFILSQNYPNPFNPTTNIVFSIPNAGNGRSRSVKIIIYNILGREISTLVNEKLQPGTYEVEWPAPMGDRSIYASGIYFYKLITDNFIETKKMILLK